MANFLVGTNVNTYALADQARAANVWISKVQSWIFEVDGSWEYDDHQYSDFPYTTFTLQNNQQDYALPAASTGDDVTTLVALLGISIKNSAGLWSKLHLIEDWNKIGVDRYEYQKTAGVPNEFDVFGNSAWLFPKPDTSQVTAVDGGRMYFKRTGKIFTASTTSTSPPFSALFHPIIGYGMALEYAKANLRDSGIVGDLLADIYGGQKDGAIVEGFKLPIQKHYANRDKTKIPRFIPNRMMRRQYR